jgi:2-hydroxy-6-oxonona-2,4-dienedioate hydrolase
MSQGFVRGEEARSQLDAWYEQFRARILAPTSSRVVSTRFGETHMLVAGPESAPPIVLLHGAMASSAHALAEAGPLVQRFRVYAIDVMGQSHKTVEHRCSYDGDDYGAWLADVFGGLALDRAHVVGVSLGGFVALRAQRAHPELFRTLSLVVPAGLVRGSAWVGFRDVGWPMLTYKLFPSEARLRRFFLAIFTNWDEDWARYFVESSKLMKIDLRVPPLLTPEDVKLQVPVLVIGAERDLSFPGQALVARARELFPDVETHLLEGSRHSPPTTPEGRAQIAELITAFLERSVA